MRWFQSICFRVILVAITAIGYAASFTNVASFINNITLTGRTITSNGSTPEDKALAWLTLQDPLRIVPGSVSNQTRLRQRYGLLTLWFQHTVVPWNFKTNWLSSAHECTWYGVLCTSNILTTISMSSNNLQCSIPVDLGVLTSLVKFEMNADALYGTIPSSIGAWSDLQFFAVWDNGLIGTLPPSIGNWRKLQTAVLYYNSFTGSLPATIGQWTNIDSMEVHHNSLTGTLPSSIGNWNKIRTIGLHNNLFSGTLPQSVGNWTLLGDAQFQVNTFRGALPDSIGNWKLSRLVMYTNSFTGTIPASVGAWSNLDQADLNTNKFSGQLPASIANWTRIVYLDITTNDFTGSIPTGICKPTLNLRADCPSEVTCACCSTCPSSPLPPPVPVPQPVVPPVPVTPPSLPTPVVQPVVPPVPVVQPTAPQPVPVRPVAPPVPVTQPAIPPQPVAGTNPVAPSTPVPPPLPPTPIVQPVVPPVPVAQPMVPPTVPVPVVQPIAPPPVPVTNPVAPVTSPSLPAPVAQPVVPPVPVVQPMAPPQPVPVTNPAAQPVPVLPAPVVQPMAPPAPVAQPMVPPQPVPVLPAPVVQPMAPPAPVAQPMVPPQPVPVTNPVSLTGPAQPPSIPAPVRQPDVPPVQPNAPQSVPVTTPVAPTVIPPVNQDNSTRTINFSEFLNQSFTGSPITDQYADSHGVIFGPDLAYVQTNLAVAPTQILAAFDRTTGTFFKGFISGRFVERTRNGTFADVTVRKFSFTAGTFSQAGSARVEWFDPSGILIDQRTNQKTGTEQFTVQGGNIARFRISASATEPIGIWIDDFGITTGSSRILFRELKADAQDGSWGSSTLVLPGFDHVAFSYMDTVFESHPGYTKGPIYVSADGLENRTVTNMNGVQNQHSRATFKHNSPSKDTTSVINFQEIVISNVEAVEMQKFLSSRVKVSRFLAFNSVSDYIAGHSPAAQKGSGNSFSGCGLIEWAAEQAKVNNGQGFIPNALESINTPTGVLPLLSPELLFFALRNQDLLFSSGQTIMQGYFDPVDYVIIDPLGRRIGIVGRKPVRGTPIPGASPPKGGDIESITIANPIPGDYTLQVFGIPKEKGIAALRVNNVVIQLNTTGDASIQQETLEAPVQAGSRGDVTKDGKIDMADVNFLIMRNGQNVRLEDPGDLNDDLKINQEDVDLLKKLIDQGVSPPPTGECRKKHACRGGFWVHRKTRRRECSETCSNRRQTRNRLRDGYKCGKCPTKPK